MVQTAPKSHKRDHLFSLCVYYTVLWTQVSLALNTLPFCVNSTSLDIVLRWTIPKVVKRRNILLDRTMCFFWQICSRFLDSPQFANAWFSGWWSQISAFVKPFSSMGLEVEVMDTLANGCFGEEKSLSQRVFISLPPCCCWAIRYMKTFFNWKYICNLRRWHCFWFLNFYIFVNNKQWLIISDMDCLDTNIIQIFEVMSILFTLHHSLLSS